MKINITKSLIVFCAVLVATLASFNAFSNESKQGRSGGDSNLPVDITAQGSDSDSCAGDADSRSTAPSGRISVPGENVVRISPNQRGRRMSEEAISRIPPQALERLNVLTRNSNGVINSQRNVAQQIGDESIFESRAMEVQTITPDGILSCEFADNFIDQVIDDSEGITFIGGPLDNQ